MKRFTETDKWSDPWFRQLKPAEKLTFLFVLDSCNNAGFYEIDYGMVEIQTGMKREMIDKSLAGISRGCVLCDGWIWVRNFLKHQKNAVINPQNPYHKQIIGLIKEQVPRFGSNPDFQSSMLAPNKGLISPIGQTKVKVKVRKVGVQGEKTEMQKRVEKIFHRRESTALSEKEAEAFSKLTIEAEDVELVEAWHTASIPPDRDIRRKDLVTVLNNWTSEVDRAREWTRKNPKSFARANGSNANGTHEPPGFRAWLRDAYPERSQTVWNELSPGTRESLMTEFRKGRTAGELAGAPRRAMWPKPARRTLCHNYEKRALILDSPCFLS